MTAHYSLPKTAAGCGNPQRGMDIEHSGPKADHWRIVDGSRADDDSIGSELQDRVRRGGWRAIAADGRRVALMDISRLSLPGDTAADRSPPPAFRAGTTRPG